MMRLASFIIFATSMWALLMGAMAVLMNYDRIIARAVEWFEIPFWLEAQIIAASIHRSPEEWEVSRSSMKHPALGEINTYSSISVEIFGHRFGRWQPNAIERRIIWNAIEWRQRSAIRKALMTSDPLILDEDRRPCT